MRHFLQYWKHYNPKHEFNNPLRFAASAQFVRMSPGDVLWIVALKEGRLTLLGRLVIDRIINRENAIKELDGDIHIAPPYAIAKQGTIHDSVEIDIQGLAAQLRFNSPKGKLKLSKPDFTNGQQLQTVREVTPDTVSLLEAELRTRVKPVGH